jgi:hypothetical protein
MMRGPAELPQFRERLLGRGRIGDEHVDGGGLGHVPELDAADL